MKPFSSWLCLSPVEARQLHMKCGTVSSSTDYLKVVTPTTLPMEWRKAELIDSICDQFKHWWYLVYPYCKLLDRSFRSHRINLWSFPRWCTLPNQMLFWMCCLLIDIIQVSSKTRSLLLHIKPSISRWSRTHQSEYRECCVSYCWKYESLLSYTLPGAAWLFLIFVYNSKMSAFFTTITIARSLKKRLTIVSSGMWISNIPSYICFKKEIPILNLEKLLHY